jgi:predicted Fe-Mo cluster-binding NifX family protein
MIVCVPVTAEGSVDPRWGRAERIALAELSADAIANWQELDVGWGGLHDSGSEGSHHARIARFLREQCVEAVVADHMGQPMQQMLDKLGIKVRLGAGGDAKAAVLATLDER